jgi:hypothetical protein
MTMLPTIRTQQWAHRLLFVGFIGVREPVYWAANSHGEWVEKTALAGANREIFCFD